ncbi:MAG: hypothetical protein DWQ05_20215 [Calditrichaeota bacterium]|nr:MAG: hypothetical protein DWQ05_20215 [Calditrichota bacterium]
MLKMGLKVVMILWVSVFIFSCGNEQKLERKFKEGYNRGFEAGKKGAENRKFQEGFEKGRERGFKQGYAKRGMEFEISHRPVIIPKKQIYNLVSPVIYYVDKSVWNDAGIVHKSFYNFNFSDENTRESKGALIHSLSSKELNLSPGYKQECFYVGDTLRIEDTNEFLISFISFEGFEFIRQFYTLFREDGCNLHLVNTIPTIVGIEKLNEVVAVGKDEYIVISEFNFGDGGEFDQSFIFYHWKKPLSFNKVIHFSAHSWPEYDEEKIEYIFNKDSLLLDYTILKRKFDKTNKKMSDWSIKETKNVDLNALILKQKKQDE